MVIWDIRGQEIVRTSWVIYYYTKAKINNKEQ